MLKRGDPPCDALRLSNCQWMGSFRAISKKNFQLIWGNSQDKEIDKGQNLIARFQKLRPYINLYKDIWKFLTF